jgi:uncharacterized phage-associated protein
MVNVLDAAAYILEKKGEMTAMKLQKLVYYSQAWSTVWDDEVLFDERIEAWANGPVCPVLYDKHKGVFKLAAISGGRPSRLSQKQKSTVDVVLEYYGKKTAQYLSQLSHSEAPWKDARKGLSATERGCKVITPAAMVEYYGSLIKSN